jgi:GxxExxY protein
MSIICDKNITLIDQDEFHAVDKVVMRHAFDIHNSMGRFCDECIYQDELSQRCRNEFQVDKEVLVRISHQNFSKSYFIDMLINNSIIYELKTVKSTNKTHQKQLINYLLLTDIKHGKLLNFRPYSVESRFVSTTLNSKDRMAFRLVDKQWYGDDSASRKLHETLISLLNNWGAFLDINLYKEAISFFMNGSRVDKTPVKIQINGRIAGTQQMNLINDDIAFHLSAITDNPALYETHINRLLNHTPLKMIQWINFNKKTISLKTIKK